MSLPASPTRQVGGADIEAIREVTQTFLRLDNLFGGGRARPTVVRYLHDEVAPLLRDGRYTEPTGRELFAAAAELTRLAGWMAYDLEQHGLAQRYLIQALRFAHEAKDHALGGEILAGMSHQAVYVGKSRRRPRHGPCSAQQRRQSRIACSCRRISHHASTCVCD